MSTIQKSELADTGERMIPEFHKGTLIYAEHMIRYQSAEEIVKGKTILDIASGSGYGTNLLAKSAKKAYGVDVSEEAISYAKNNYAADNIEFILGDGEKIPLADNSVEVVVTFETIEHIKDYKKFMSEIRRVLTPDGVAIVSTPNDIEFAEGNHFHLHEFEYKELYDMVKADFKYVDSYYQGTWKYVALGDIELFENEQMPAVQTFNYAPLKRDQTLYFYLVCSNKKITKKLSPMGAVGQHYSDKKQQEYDLERSQLERAVINLNKMVADKDKEFQEKVFEVENLKTDIKNIKNSKSYHLAQKASSIRNKIDPKN